MVVRCNLSEQEIICINHYVSPNANLPSFLIRLEPFVRRYNAGHLLCGYFNSKNVVWGGQIDDDRGTLLLEFFSGKFTHCTQKPL